MKLRVSKEAKDCIGIFGKAEETKDQHTSCHSDECLMLDARHPLSLRCCSSCDLDSSFQSIEELTARLEPVLRLLERAFNRAALICSGTSAIGEASFSSIWRMRTPPAP